MNVENIFALQIKQKTALNFPPDDYIARICYQRICHRFQYKEKNFGIIKPIEKLQLYQSIAAESDHPDDIVADKLVDIYLHDENIISEVASRLGKESTKDQLFATIRKVQAHIGKLLQTLTVGSTGGSIPPYFLKIDEVSQFANTDVAKSKERLVIALCRKINPRYVTTVEEIPGLSREEGEEERTLGQEKQELARQEEELKNESDNV